MKEKAFVLKVGGSIMYDNGLNMNLSVYEKIKDWYYNEKSNYDKLVIVVGGGTLSRELQEKIADSIGGEEYLHNIGMSVTQTNASVLQGFIGDEDIYIPKKLGDAYEYLWQDEQSIIVSGGLKVGWSTDMDAAIFADILDVEMIYKLSNVEYIYKEDPRINPNASPIKDMNWNEYKDLFHITEDSVHKANYNVPIDFECANFCYQKNISFFVTGGQKLNTENQLSDILTDGTLIHP